MIILKKNKVEKIIKKFSQDNSSKILFDLPILKFKNKNSSQKIRSKKFYSILLA